MRLPMLEITHLGVSNAKIFRLRRAFSSRICCTIINSISTEYKHVILFGKRYFYLLRGRSSGPFFERRFLGAPITLGSENSFSRTLSRCLIEVSRNLDKS